MILIQVMHPYHEKSATSLSLSLSPLLGGKKTKPLHIHEAYSVLSMEDDWDLQAVVRGYAATTITNYYSTSSSAVSHGSSNHSHSDQPPSNFLSHSLPFEPRNDMEELQQLCPLFPKSHTPLVSPVSAHNVRTEQTQVTQLQSPRSKRRKNQLKKVCRVTAESLSSSVWAWRKYGQKPIKGSPYPRGYYRCSSSKECLARKQVERDRSDSGMFIVTYTAEHNHPAPTHRNSLAGSTRQKPSTSKTVTGGEQNRAQATQLACFSSSAEDGVIRRSTETERKGEKEYLLEDEEDEQGTWGDTMADNDFFVGLEDLDDEDAGDYFPDNNYSEDLGHSWIANDSTTAAGDS